MPPGLRHHVVDVSDLTGVRFQERNTSYVLLPPYVLSLVVKNGVIPNPVFR